MADTFRVAVASNKKHQSDVAFSKMQEVTIYEMDERNIRELGERKLPHAAVFSKINGSGCPGKNEEYLNAVATALEDCRYLLIAEIGSYPSRVLLRNGIQALEQQGNIDDLLIIIQNYEKEHT